MIRKFIGSNGRGTWCRLRSPIFRQLGARSLVQRVIRSLLWVFSSSGLGWARMGNLGDKKL